MLNNNENAIVSKFKKFHELNTVLVPKIAREEQQENEFTPKEKRKKKKRWQPGPL